jgi:hypothetical protein
MQKPNIVIADLDGTITLIDHRRHWLDAERHPDMTSDERWRRFFADCANDQPNHPVIQTLKALRRDGYYIHIFSGRSDEAPEQTIDWIEAFGVPYHYCELSVGWYGNWRQLPKTQLISFQQSSPGRICGHHSHRSNMDCLNSTLSVPRS